MQIRHADPAADGASCAAVYAPFVTDSVISFEYEAPSGGEMARRIARLSQTHAYLVAEDDGSGTVVGFAYGSPHRERAAYGWATEVSVYVAPSHHRRGLGRALYRALFERLGARGFRIALAGISLPNEASVGLHEALGFEPVGIYRRVGWKKGAWWDVGWWQLFLGSASDPSPAVVTGSADQPTTPLDAASPCLSVAVARHRAQRHECSRATRRDSRPDR